MADDEEAMDNMRIILGFVFLVVGVTLIITAVFRSLTHRWTLGVHELWLLPLTGIALVLVGRWLIQ